MCVCIAPGPFANQAIFYDLHRDGLNTDILKCTPFCGGPYYPTTPPTRANDNGNKKKEEDKKVNDHDVQGRVRVNGYVHVSYLKRFYHLFPLPQSLHVWWNFKSRDNHGLIGVLHVLPLTGGNDDDDDDDDDDNDEGGGGGPGVMAAPWYEIADAVRTNVTMEGLLAFGRARLDVTDEGLIRVGEELLRHPQALCLISR